MDLAELVAEAGERDRAAAAAAERPGPRGPRRAHDPLLRDDRPARPPARDARPHRAVRPQAPRAGGRDQAAADRRAQPRGDPGVVADARRPPARRGWRGSTSRATAPGHGARGVLEAGPGAQRRDRRRRPSRVRSRPPRRRRSRVPLSGRRHRSRSGSSSHRSAASPSPSRAALSLSPADARAIARGRGPARRRAGTPRPRRARTRRRP